MKKIALAIFLMANSLAAFAQQAVILFGPYASPEAWVQFEGKLREFRLVSADNQVDMARVLPALHLDMAENNPAALQALPKDMQEPAGFVANMGRFGLQPKMTLASVKEGVLKQQFKLVVAGATPAAAPAAPAASAPNKTTTAPAVVARATEPVVPAITPEQVAEIAQTTARNVTDGLTKAVGALNARIDGVQTDAQVIKDLRATANAATTAAGLAKTNFEQAQAKLADAGRVLQEQADKLPGMAATEAEAAASSAVASGLATFGGRVSTLETDSKKVNDSLIHNFGSIAIAFIGTVVLLLVWIGRGNDRRLKAVNVSEKRIKDAEERAEKALTAWVSAGQALVGNEAKTATRFAQVATELAAVQERVEVTAQVVLKDADWRLSEQQRKELLTLAHRLKDGQIETYELVIGKSTVQLSMAGVAGGMIKILDTHLRPCKPQQVCVQVATLYHSDKLPSPLPTKLAVVPATNVA